LKFRKDGEGQRAKGEGCEATKLAVIPAKAGIPLLQRMKKMKHLNYILLLALFTACTPRQSGQVEVSDNLVAVYSVSEIDSVVDLEIDDVLISELDYVFHRPAGAIYTGQKINEFIALVEQQQFEVRRETMQIEFDYYYVYNVYANGEILYAVEPNWSNPNIVGRIWMFSPKFRTEAGIGIGSTFAEIISTYQIQFISTEGDDDYVTIGVEETSISFGINARVFPEGWFRDGCYWERMRNRELPDSLPIGQMVMSSRNIHITPDFQIITIAQNP